MRTIVLFGMMGAGKSSVARLVADRLGRELVDTDAAVEAAAGRTVSQIFDHEGEPAFRRREREAVAAAARDRDRVVSLGGGAVLDERNVAVLRPGGVLIHLEAPAETLVERLSEERGRRPLLVGHDLSGALAALLDARTPAYRSVADHTVDATADVEQVAVEVLRVVAGEPDVLSDDERARISA